MAKLKLFFTRQYRASYRYRGESVIPEGGIIQNWEDRMFQYNWRNQAFYQQKFADRHDIDIMVGMELRKNDFTEVHTKGFGFDENSMTTKPVFFPDNYSSADSQGLRQYSKRFIENAYASFFSTASYSFDNKYILFGSIRYDGSNLFGVDPKYKYLPLWSVSGAWNAHNEEFLKDIDWLNSLKLRGSYGLQGNIDKNTSPFVKGYWNNTSFFPGQTEPTINVTSPPNKYLRWEKTSTTNLGFDLSLVDNRINISFDAYNRKSQDLISSKSLPHENGFNSVSINWAEVSNKGWEVSLSTVNVKTKNFRWNTDFNISKNKSKVNQINTPDNDWFPSREGYPVDAVFGIKTAGVDKDGMMQFINKDGEKVGMKEFYNLEKGTWSIRTLYNPKEFRDLFTYMGDMSPKLTGGFNNRFSYKNIDLAISSHFAIDRTVRETPFYNPTQIDPGTNHTTRMNNVWTEENKGGIYPRVLAGNTGNEAIDMAYSWINSSDASRSFNYYDIWMKKISSIRISSIRLGYTLNKDVLKSNHISSIRFNLEARNPFVLGSSYDGYFDPESYGNIYSQPTPKTFSFGVNVSF